MCRKSLHVQFMLQIGMNCFLSQKPVLISFDFFEQILYGQFQIKVKFRLQVN